MVGITVEVISIEVSTGSRSEEKVSEGCKEWEDSGGLIDDDDDVVCDAHEKTVGCEKVTGPSSVGNETWLETTIGRVNNEEGGAG